MKIDFQFDEGPDDGVDLEAAFWRAARAYRDPEGAAAVAASHAVDADIEIPTPPGLSYLPFQKAGVLYCLKKFGDVERNKETPISVRGVLIADEMGL